MRGAARPLLGHGPASDYAAKLLLSLGVPLAREPGRADPHPDLDWARSGAMTLTGEAKGPPLLAPGPLAACARGALAALRALSETGPLDALDAPALLGERAAHAQLTRAGRTSPGGACRLIRAADGWLALSLARPDDAALLEAWLQERALRGTPQGKTASERLWSVLARVASQRSLADLIERGRLLGLALAPSRAPLPAPPPWLRSTRLRAAGPKLTGEGARAGLVVDLSSLWAGPLCTHLLQQVGARVLKVESSRRPDGARSGPPAFFDLMHGGQESVALDLSVETGRRALRALIERADLLVESSRPRALAQLGVDAAEWVAARPGRTWLSITGYGRAMPGGGWVAFGDDAGVAAGLACATAQTNGLAAPIFCGDAIADPLSGLHAAVAALASWRMGGGLLLDIALRDVVAHALAAHLRVGVGVHASRVHECREEPIPGGAEPTFEVLCGDGSARVRAPLGRSPVARARPLGADTRAVLRELGAGC